MSDDSVPNFHRQDLIRKAKYQRGLALVELESLHFADGFVRYLLLYDLQFAGMRVNSSCLFDTVVFRLKRMERLVTPTCALFTSD